MWDLSCPDWEDRIREGRSLIPELPLVESEARLGLQFFNELQLPDVPGLPKLRDACGPWFRDIARAAFGSWDPDAGKRYIRDIFTLAPKGSSKTSYSAGLMIAAMLMNKRPRGEMLFVGPMQAIADRAYDQAVGMIEASPDLKRRFRTRDHVKTIEDLANHSEMKVKTFDVNILTGSILIFALLDELHLLGRNPHTTKVLRQIRGGLDKTPEGLLLITTTQSDDVPTGAFRDELVMARTIRDGAYRGKNIRPMLPVLYEFPRDIARERTAWEDPSNWPMINPNLGRSVNLDSLISSWETEKTKGEYATRVWASQHLSIEIGQGLSSHGWAGADYWEACGDPELTLQALRERSDVVVVGIDGGGLDDLLGFAVLGRDRETGRWLHWAHAWAHPIVMERRKDIAEKLADFARDGDLTIVNSVGDDVEEVADIVHELETAGLLPGENAIGVDPVGIGAIVDALAERGIDNSSGPRIIGLPQGWKLNGAIKTTERKLAGGDLIHGALPLMAWVVGNARVEPRGSAITITKQAAGSAKIDPLMATFDAAALMAVNPDGKRSVYEEHGFLII